MHKRPIEQYPDYILPFNFVKASKVATTAIRERVLKMRRNGAGYSTIANKLRVTYKFAKNICELAGMPMVRERRRSTGWQEPSRELAHLYNNSHKTKGIP